MAIHRLKNMLIQQVPLCLMELTLRLMCTMLQPKDILMVVVCVHVHLYAIYKQSSTYKRYSLCCFYIRKLTCGSIVHAVFGGYKPARLSSGICQRNLSFVLIWCSFQYMILMTGWIHSQHPRHQGILGSPSSCHISPSLILLSLFAHQLAFWSHKKRCQGLKLYLKVRQSH